MSFCKHTKRYTKKVTETCPCCNADNERMVPIGWDDLDEEMQMAMGAMQNEVFAIKDPKLRLPPPGAVGTICDECRPLLEGFVDV